MLNKKNTSLINTRKKLTRNKDVVNNVKTDINKIIKMYKLINKFKLFYKTLSYKDRRVIENYNNNGYLYINSFLYDNNKLTTLSVNKFIFNKDYKYLLKKYFTKYINYKTQTFKSTGKFISFYMNSFVINGINTLDKLFNNEHINILKGNEILYRGDNGNIINNNNIHIGDDVVFKNFISSSVDKHIPLDFINKTYFTKKKNNVCCMYMLYKLQYVPYIYIPRKGIYNKNIKTLSIANYMFDEYECVLPRNLKFKLINITYELIEPALLNFTLKFKQLNTITKKINNQHMENNNLDNNDYNILIPKMYAKQNIKIYHLEFIEQIPSEKIEPYIYNNDIDINLY